MGRKLHVRPLGDDASEAGLRAALAAIGYPPRSVAIVLDRETGRSRGFGLIEVEDDAAATALVTLAAGGGVRLGGAALVVQPARPRSGGPW